MNKEREYKYDNLKFIMIFFVVFAHFLQMIEGESIRYIYIFIYTFHMPIFVYISGYFAKGSKKSILRFLYIYVLWQTIIYLVNKLILKTDFVLDYGYPAWAMWYMLAMAVWNLIIKLIDEFLTKEHWIIYIVMSIVISLAIGVFDFIGHEWSIARIITFLPYFLLGYFNKKFDLNILELKKDGKFIKKKIVILAIMLIISGGYFIKNMNIIEGKWLHGAFSYFIQQYDAIFKLMWITLSIAELFIFYNIVTNKKVPIISKAGSNTLTIYLVHAVILTIMRQYKTQIFAGTEIFNLFLALIFTCILIGALGNDFIKKKLIYMIDPIKIIEDVKKLIKGREEKSKAIN